MTPTGSNASDNAMACRSSPSSAKNATTLEAALLVSLVQNISFNNCVRIFWGRR